MWSLLFWAVAGTTAKLRGGAQVSANSQELQARGAALSRRDGVYYLNEMLNKFNGFAEETSRTVHQRHVAEAHRLQAAQGELLDPIAAAAINQSLTTNLESEREAEEVLGEMTKFIRTMQGVTSTAAMPGTLSCGNKNCGPHASCTRTTLGPECVCDEGYEGDGLSCSVPVLFRPSRLLHDGLHGRSPQVADLNVALAGGRMSGSDRLLLVYRDLSHKTGRVMVGTFTAAHVEWGPPEAFTAGDAYDPIIVGNPDVHSLTIVFRDDDRDATLWVRSGEIGASGIRGADKHITWGHPVSLAQSQSHRAVLLPLGADKVCAMYTDHTPATKTAAERHFAVANLMQVGTGGSVMSLGTFHLLEFAATRLTAVLLSPTSFVVGYRGAKHVDEMDATVVVRQEASVVYGELVDAELVVDPHPLDLEPATTNVWDRGLSLLAPGVFGYAYQTGLDQTTRLAVVRVDPASHHMTVLQRSVVHDGFTPFVRMVNVPYAPEDPHSLTLFENGDRNTASVCAVENAAATPTDGALSHCETMTWLDRKVESVSAVAIGAGRVLFAFADQDGVPYIQVVGLSKK